MGEGLYARRTAGGFTLLELMIVVSILAIVASIGIPQYVSALRTARVGKAKHELVTISHAIDSFTATNGGKLPLSLYQVGFGGKRDPWGVSYCYLNYADGTGDGLEWAIAAGIVDPSAFGSLVGGSGDGAGAGLGGGGGDGGDGRGFATLRWNALASGLYQKQVAQDRGKVSKLDFGAISTKLGRSIDLPERIAIEQSVSTNGDFSFFTGVPSEQARRRDRYLFPLNTDYDLFSLGPDHQTAASLGESTGLDDVIRANNGGFFGLASNY